MPTHITQEVIRSAMAGNTNAFRIVVEEHQAFAFAVSFRLVGDEDDAEDIVQEAFVRLWKNMHRYKPEIKLTTWLYRIIVNLCLDFLKSSQGRQRNNRTDISKGRHIADVSTPEKELDRRELMDLIHQAADELTPKQRTVFILRDVEALTVEEVCHLLSMSAGKVKSNLYYARVKMREKLKAYYQITDNPMSA